MTVASDIPFASARVSPPCWSSVTLDGAEVPQAGAQAVSKELSLDSVFKLYSIGIVLKICTSKINRRAALRG